MNNKVVVIGCGNVGTSYVYALLNQKTKVDEVILIDVNEDKALGEAMDLNHGLAFAPSKMIIRKGNYKDCSDAKIVVISAGKNQEVDETRMDLTKKNTEVFNKVVKEVKNSGFDGIYLVATNPVDVMTYITWKNAGCTFNKVMGTGTTLDTARLRFLLSEKININVKNIHAYVIGEHGDSEFVLWSSAMVGMQSIKDFLKNSELNDIYEEVRNSAYNIINKKGNTCYGIGMSMAEITNAILSDSNAILTISSYDSYNDVFIGGPAIVNRDGYKRTYINLDKEEEIKLQNSIDIINQALKKIK